jgi:hypothetical protein
LARASGLNEVVVHTNFDVLENIVDENKIRSSRIFNMDKTSHAVVQRPEKIIAQKGKRQVGAISPCERGQNVTGVYTVSTSGLYVPPMLIYPRKSVKESLSYGAPADTAFRCQGRILKCSVNGSHFISAVKPIPQEKLLLILDGHSSHTQKLAAIEIARRHEVVMLSLSPHSTHRMQPLDLKFIKPLYTYMASAIATKLREKHGQRLWTEYCVAGRHGVPNGCSDENGY